MSKRSNRRKLKQSRSMTKRRMFFNDNAVRRRFNRNTRSLYRIIKKYYNR